MPRRHMTRLRLTGTAGASSCTAKAPRLSAHCMCVTAFLLRRSALLNFAFEDYPEGGTGAAGAGKHFVQRLHTILSPEAYTSNLPLSGVPGAAAAAAVPLQAAPAEVARADAGVRLPASERAACQSSDNSVSSTWVAC